MKGPGVEKMTTIGEVSREKGGISGNAPEENCKVLFE